MSSRRWSVVLPLKGGTSAKSRLGAPPAVAEAIALDCLDAVLRASQVGWVVVVTPDTALSAYAAAAGASVRPESNPGSGLAAAIDDGLRGLAGPAAVLLGDLPALRSADLDAALLAAAGRLDAGATAVFVPDCEGTGTVLLCAREVGAMRPSFGPASASAHERSGASRLDADLPRLRRDVDTPRDLESAARLGLGPRTRAALSLLPPNPVVQLDPGRGLSRTTKFDAGR